MAEVGEGNWSSEKQQKQDVQTSNENRATGKTPIRCIVTTTKKLRKLLRENSKSGSSGAKLGKNNTNPRKKEQRISFGHFSIHQNVCSSGRRTSHYPTMADDATGNPHDCHQTPGAGW
jgi:hypothetical protein